MPVKNSFCSTFSWDGSNYAANAINFGRFGVVVLGSRIGLSDEGHHIAAVTNLTEYEFLSARRDFRQAMTAFFPFVLLEKLSDKCIACKSVIRNRGL